jgi:hypothetical protein
MRKQIFVAAPALIALATARVCLPVAATEPPTREAASQLEFRIVANETDDQKAFQAAQAYFAEAARNPQHKQELENKARNGLPPSPPKPVEGQAFTTPLGRFTYSWVELSPNMAREWKLAGEGEQADAEQAKKVKDARLRTLRLLVPPGILIYSHQLGDKKTVQYFVLLRDPNAGKAITREHLAQVNLIDARGDAGHKAINVNLNERGGKLLSELTSQNRPSGENGQTCRQLAIVLGGKVMAAPKIRSIIGQNCQISGHFSKEQADSLVTILRAPK